MQPFIGLFGVSTTTHAIGMLLFLALFVTARVFLPLHEVVHELDRDNGDRVVAAVVLK